MKKTTKITIKNPAESATTAQRRVIAQAVKAATVSRLEKDQWDNLTKGQASEIITKLNKDKGEPLATWAQKKRFSELVKDGYLRGIKRENFTKLTSSFAKVLIYKGMKNKEAGIFAEPYDPEPLAA